MRKILLQLLILFITPLSFGQVVLSIATSDNCMAPTPNAGTYTQSGTLNGKPMYVKGANLRIVWTGTQWEIQGDDPAIGGVSWFAGWVNTKNTATPPTDCWTSPSGCFQATLSGANAFPVVNSAANPTIVLASSTSTTVTYTVTFSAAINGLTASNFNVVATGVTGSIASVTQTASPNIYTVVVNYGTGNGSVRLDIANDTGAGALIGCATSFPIQGAIFYTYNAPVTLTTGDIAFTGYNSSGVSPALDDFSFVVLKSGGLTAGTKLFFTDNGFNNITNALTTNEGTIFFDVTSTIPQFTQVKISAPASGSTYTISASTGAATATLLGTTNIAFSTAGDQIISYQGSIASSTFIVALHMNAEASGATNPGSLTTWDDFNNGNSSSRSYIPTGLTNGTNAVMVVNGSAVPYTEFDNAIYNCTGSPGTAATLRTAINDRANWTKQDTTVYTTPPTCTFLGNTNFDFIKLTVFPNPTNGLIYLQLEAFNNDVNYKVYDINGRILKSSKILSQNSEINVSDLNSGIYLLEIASNEGKTIKQFIKQ